MTTKSKQLSILYLQETRNISKWFRQLSALPFLYAMLAWFILGDQQERVNLASINHIVSSRITITSLQSPFKYMHNRNKWKKKIRLTIALSIIHMIHHIIATIMAQIPHINIIIQASKKICLLYTLSLYWAYLARR